MFDNNEKDEQFAGPAAQRRVRSCLKLLFNWFSLIIVPPQGAWASEVPAPSPRRSLQNRLVTRRGAVLRFFCRPGGLRKSFLPPSVADRLPHTFPEASGVHFGINFALKMIILDTCSVVPWGLFLELFFRCFLQPKPSNI